MGAAFFVAVFPAQRFFKAATIAALPAALSLRFVFGTGAVTAAGTGASDSPLIFAHRRCWASFIRLRAVAENFLRLPFVGSGVAVVPEELPSSMARSSAILVSMRAF